MDDLDIILTLIPEDRCGLALDACRFPHNHSWYAPPSAFIDDGPPSRDGRLSRETTPFGPTIDHPPVDEPDNLHCLHRLVLPFNQKTKTEGRVTFGSDPALCDVLLTLRRGQHGTSGRHFYITFDHNKRPMIVDNSTNGLTVSYDKQAKYERRKHFRWIIFEDFKKITTQYDNNVERFMANSPPLEVIAFDNLVLRSQGTSLAPSESLSPTRRPIYLKQGELGKGTFGLVRKVINASTGHEYAGKEFFHKKGWEKEIEIMKCLCHDNIVRFIDSRTVPDALIVMEYLPLGSLEAQDRVSSISEADTLIVFNQSLEGLSYLHGQKITHRDLKPDNILVNSRTPLHIKLADFGLAQNRSDLQTNCGSNLYKAPEIFLGQHYTNVVDIWSLAVIVMRFVYGLPEKSSAGNIKGKEKGKAKHETVPFGGKSWCQRLIDSAADWESDDLIDFLTQHMLRWDPQERMSAAECLRRAFEINLFSEPIAQTGGLTPRLPSAYDTEELSTFIISPGNVDSLSQNVPASVRTGKHRLLSTGPLPSIPGADEPTPSAFAKHCDARSVKRRRTANDAESPR